MLQFNGRSGIRMHSPTSNVQAAKRENHLLFPIFANIQGGFDRNEIRIMKQSGTVGGELYSRDSHVTDIYALEVSTIT